ncbi:MAG: polyprenyl synthetase family protein [Nitrospiraceae bacterium]|nr:polyprenyl synthetase family protein [Nitrospira sp.]MCB9776451.1 polyprenyl synthetase family protein [Nitrospiraceae bacterium]
MNIQVYLDQQRQRVDRFLEGTLPLLSANPQRLYESMRYSLLGGGKRIRPILTIAAAQALGYDRDAMLPFAASLEFVHTYSLIHDDLPAMDDDDYRRGRLTNHKVYGDGMAILAGDALLTMAFELCSQVDGTEDFSAAQQLAIVRELASGSGHQGMVGGQVMDIQAENQEIDLVHLQQIHTFKTGRLIRAAVRIGSIIGEATTQQMQCLTDYSEDIGLAFQIADDVLDMVGTREELGKDAGTDERRGKRTYPSFFGVEGARQLGEECVQRAIARLNTFDKQADPLRHIATYIMARRS